MLSRATFLAFISFSAAGVQRDMPGPRLSVKEKNSEVDRESLLQPIMSVICTQTEERRDKERPSDTTHTAESTFMYVCVLVCIRVCVCACVCN